MSRRLVSAACRVYDLSAKGLEADFLGGSHTDQPPLKWSALWYGF